MTLPSLPPLFRYCTKPMPGRTQRATQRYFCNDVCVKQFAYAMAKYGLATQRWTAAYQAQLQCPVGPSK